MSTPAIHISNTDVSLKPAPIHPDWIREGRPMARNCVLSKSRDGAAMTMVWDCTAGVFEWIYDVDETIHLVEGEVILTDPAGTRKISAGDVVFFPAGSKATWRVERYVRKVAFFRHTLPQPVALAMRAWRQASVRLERLAATPLPLPRPALTLIMATAMSLAPVMA
ncbi:MAG: cupin domain-containing protein [Caulobacteraceae bacterium]|nr:cupin domain-containing protein [Caulobacteraceae bacterium]